MSGQDTGGCRYRREMENNMNYTYLLECSDGTLYCGWTNDLEKKGEGAQFRARGEVHEVQTAGAACVV